MNRETSSGSRSGSRRLAALLASIMGAWLLSACSSGVAFSDDLRSGLGDELADCLEENLDDEVIETLNETGIQIDLMDEATADAYTTAVSVCPA